MYEEHFGLAERPFQLTPDARFWFDTATHRKAMAYLGYGLAQGEGFIVITGDIGAGKTTLVAHLMDRIDPANLNVIRIVSTAVDPDDLLRIVAAGLGIAGEGKSKAELLLLIERGLHSVARTGRRTLLIVDEAQALPVAALEELRMLSNFQAGGQAMVQIFLLGQPEFRDRLNGSDRLEQLRQRVIAVHHLDPMGVDEVAPYVGHRLAIAGWKGRPDFADDAFPVLHRASGGVPRRLNQLMGRVMLHAAISEADVIDARLVRAVVDDQRRELPPVAAAARPAPVAETPAVAETPVVPETEAAPATPVEAIGEEPDVAPAPTPEPAPASVVALDDERLAMLERRIDEQDRALRRVLRLLVDWVEQDGRGDDAGEVTEMRGAA